MSAIKTYRDLLVWQRAMELAKAVYLATQHFPKVEQFGLTNQLRRAVVSVASNIAEGNGAAPPRIMFASSTSHAALSSKLKRKSNSPSDLLIYQIQTPNLCSGSATKSNGCSTPF